MSQLPRWPRRGLLAAAAAAVALALMSVPGTAAPALAAPDPVPVPAPALLPVPVRIMPLGTSSTVGTGSAGDVGFRGPLETLLIGQQIAVDMVGSQRSGPAWLADRDHEGHGGWTMAGMQPLVAGWVARQDPDIVLLQVGTNDLLAGAGPAVTARRLDTMLSTIRTVSDAHVIVAGIWAPLPGHARARTQYAHLTRGVVARHRAAGRGMTYLDTSRLLAPTDLYDGLHPNGLGYRKIARAWERAIRAHLRPGGAIGHPGLPAPLHAMAGLRVSTRTSGSGTPAASGPRDTIGGRTTPEPSRASAARLARTATGAVAAPGRAQ